MALLACTTSPAEDTHTASPDSGGDEDPCAAHTVTCELPGGGDVDAAATRQYTLTLTPLTWSGDIDEPGESSGFASLDDGGVLSWSAAPGGTLLIVEESDEGFYADATTSVDGGTTDGCTMDGTLHWVIGGRWTGDGGFAGTWTLSAYLRVGESSCSYSVTYSAVASPPG